MVEDRRGDVATDEEAGRRRALTTLFGGVMALAVTGCRRSTTSLDGGAAPADGPPIDDRDPDVHLLRRLTFGPTTAELERLRSVGQEAWLDEQLDPSSLDTASIETELVADFPELAQDSATVLADYQADPNAPRIGAVLPAATVVRHVRSPAQLLERMIEFWGDHFNTPQTNPPSTIARIAMDREVFRPHALGRFDELLVAVAQSPAMQLYLDNFRSSVGAINENYARELLELHTVGVGGGYDEDDIVATARLLTGWGITRQLEFAFHRFRHDDRPVSILGWDRPSVGDPMAHGVAFLEHLAHLPATAEYVCRKLAVRFVADDPPAEMVDNMVTAWTTNDTAIVPVLRAMIDHEAFEAAPAKFNRPWDYLVQSLRALEVDVNVSFGPELRDAVGLVQDLGQVPFRHASPDGYPDTGSAWSNAGALLARWNTAARLTDPDDSPFRSTLMHDLAEELTGLTAASIYGRVAERLRHEPLTDDDRALLAELTGWPADRIPTDEELTEATPHLAFAMLAHPKALFR